MSEPFKRPCISVPPLGPGDGGRARRSPTMQLPLAPGESTRDAREAPTMEAPLEPGDFAGHPDGSVLVAWRPSGPGDRNLPRPVIRKPTGA